MHFSLLFQMYMDEWERCFEWNVPNQYESMIIGLKQDDPSIFKYKSVICKPWVWDHETILVGVMEKGRTIIKVKFLTSKNEKPYKGPPLLKKKILIAYACYGWSHVPDQGINSNQSTKKLTFWSISELIEHVENNWGFYIFEDLVTSWKIRHLAGATEC